MTNIYYLSERFENPNFGGVKARDDIDVILKSKKFTPIPIQFCFYNPKSLIGLIKIIKKGLSNWHTIKSQAEKGSIIFIQYPFGNTSLNTLELRKTRKSHGFRFVAFIHDIESLQTDSSSKVKELELLKLFDMVICHNTCMQRQLINLGISKNNIVVLHLFDYLTNTCPRKNRSINEGLVIAGNLASFKAAYIYKLISTSEIPVILYGTNFDERYSDKVNYMGSLPADLLIGEIKGSFGLVWDGDSLNECNGSFGEYQKINNPHRVSMYLTAQIPIFIWNKAALRDFVVDNNLGFGIDRLDDIPEILSELTEDRYQSMVQSTQSISQKLRNGYFTSRAIDETISKLK